MASKFKYEIWTIGSYSDLINGCEKPKPYIWKTVFSLKDVASTLHISVEGAKCITKVGFDSRFFSYSVIPELDLTYQIKRIWQ